jgi:hypothetical protein
MKVLLVGSCSAEAIFEFRDPDWPSEAEFEYFVIKGLSCLFPDYYCITFRGTFRDEGRSARPDLALVARNFSHWFVIEVELVSHSFEGHVLPQIRTLERGEPDEDCVGVLSQRLNISRQRAKTLLTLIPRRLAVVANKRDGFWEAGLRAHGVSLLTVSVYESHLGVEAIEFDGVLEIAESNLGFGTFSAIDRAVRFSRAIDLPPGPIQISDPGGSISSWTILRTETATWVTKDNGTPSIPDGAFVQLIKTLDGRVSLRYP